MAASKREAALLSCMAANHLFLGQFESLHVASVAVSSKVATNFLRAVNTTKGRVLGVLWSMASHPRMPVPIPTYISRCPHPLPLTSRRYASRPSTSL
ncbi:unnamed protein product [Urochloa humidicola]